MLNADIKKFAVQQGFQDVKEIGNYKDYKVYQPCFTDGKKHVIGYPHYILVNENEIKLQVDVKFEITDVIFPKNTTD